jgi:hypothetical protein
MRVISQRNSRESPKIGDRYGMLEVIDFADDLITPKGYKYKRYLCKCDCGNEKIVSKRGLTIDGTQSCGCLVGKSNLKDISGNVYGKLKVISLHHVGNTGAVYWRCKCECGNETIVRGSSLVRGDTQSCGCLRKEILSHKTHGKTNTRIHRIWSGIKSRCSNKNLPEYERYGGRGITVCDEWKTDFQSFYEWAMSNGYSDNLTIDRIDNNKGYSPDNCRWVTYKEQANNKSNNVFLSFNGELKTISQWGDELGIKDGTIRARLNHGWSIEKALTIIPSNDEIEV